MKSAMTQATEISSSRSTSQCEQLNLPSFSVQADDAQSPAKALRDLTKRMSSFEDHEAPASVDSDDPTERDEVLYKRSTQVFD